MHIHPAAEEKGEIVRRFIAVPIFALLWIAAGCSADTGEAPVMTSTSGTVATTSATPPTTTTTAPTTTTMAPRVPLTIDEAFLADQAAKSWDPKLPGAVMVAV